MTGDPLDRAIEAVWARLREAIPPDHPAWAKAPEPCRLPAADLTPHLAQLYSYSYPQRAVIGAYPPKEAPMPVPSPYTESAPFKYIDQDEDQLSIYAEPTLAETVHLDPSSVEGVYIADEDAPAVALAILQAAGIRGTHVWTATSVESAVAFLTLHVEAEARKKADAEKAAAAAEADAAKLDEEAQALRAAQLGDSHDYAPWVHISLGMKRQYRAAARKARELHGKA